MTGNGSSRRRAIAMVLVIGALLAMPAAATAAPTLPAPRVIVGVTCRSQNLCVAVGANTKRQPYIQTFNGDHWTREASPTVADGRLDAVSCGSGKSCVAVGHRGNPGKMKPVAERWNGTAWKLALPPNAAGDSTLTGVSCATIRFCVAVGYFTVGETLHTLVDHWNGTAWKRVASPSPKPGGVGSWLTSVSCTGVRNCFAVGSSYNGRADVAFVERWNGKTWSISAQPSSGGRGSLQSVACKSSTMCMAVGVDTGPIPMTSFKDRWNGKSWKITSGLHDTTDVLLAAVACPSTTSCIAVGSRNLDTPYAERWNGTSWARIAAPAPNGLLTFNGVSCSSATSCYAVGGSVVQYWNGTNWADVAAAT